jgi:hypothetical protein
MTNKITLDCEFFACSITEIELPEGYSQNDISDYYIKWLNLYVTFKDGTTYEQEINYPEIDTKRPIADQIFDTEGYI